MKYVVDTNIAIAMLSQRQPIIDRLSNLAPEDLGLSVLVVAELLFGARRSARLEENVARVRALEARFPVLPVDRPIVEHYGIVRAGRISSPRAASGMSCWPTTASASTSPFTACGTPA